MIRASGDITMKALSTNDADSTNKVSSGGVINVNNYYSKATTDATVNVLVGTQDAGADTDNGGWPINISAANNETATGKGGLIESVNGRRRRRRKFNHLCPGPQSRGRRYRYV